jgi:hypothetical protein
MDRCHQFVDRNESAVVFVACLAFLERNPLLRNAETDDQLADFHLSVDVAVAVTRGGLGSVAGAANQ